MESTTHTVLTLKQRLVLDVLEPATGTTKHTREVAVATGLTHRGAQRVLYHLHDRGLVSVDEFGYYLA